MDLILTKYYFCGIDDRVFNKTKTKKSECDQMQTEYPRKGWLEVSNLYADVLFAWSKRPRNEVSVIRRLIVETAGIVAFAVIVFFSLHIVNAMTNDPQPLSQVITFTGVATGVMVVIDIGKAALRKMLHRKRPPA